MFQRTQKKAADLIVELKKEIAVLEDELAHKKQLLDALTQLGRNAPRQVRSTVARGRKVTRPTVRKGGKTPTQRKSKNRDAILAAAERLDKKQFSLNDLKKEIHKKDPKFGGKYPSASILAALKNTPQIKKKKRGQYTFKKK